MKKILIYILATGFLCACSHKEGRLFRNPTPEETGISFSNTLTESDDLNILDYLYFYNGGGVAVGDINGDELPDIFFSGNQVKNKLYLNKGNLRFEDISEKAGIGGMSTWNTGAVMGDVNGDGLLDIYVCAVVGINGFNGHNELYINNGNATFTESAEKFGLDFESYSSSAAFLDYDLDGDLDIYLLNHAVHTQESFGKVDLRRKRNYQTGDKLLRNDNGKFTDVSEQAGIYGGVNGYGLGVAVADFNQDGYPDIYVGNDFHEDDYYYLNNGDGTFTESLKDYFSYSSRFSMGNDVADINHDGWPDIMSMDMLPEDEKVLKASEGSADIQVQKIQTERFGYHYQFARNMLYVNQPNSSFTETGLLSGVAATDWSWSTLFGDYNQDGEQDIFISNGIPKRPNDLDYINFVSDEQIKIKMNNTKLVDQKALNMMPSGAVHNYIFKGTDDLRFEDKSGKWIVNDTLISGATAMADLDLDGDLDLVINTINSPASLYVNKTDNTANYIKLKFNYTSPNRFGIGTKVFSYHGGKLQYKELYPVRGFQASSEPVIHFGYGESEIIDSLKILWPDKTYQVLTQVKVNQTLKVKPEHPQVFRYETLQPETQATFKKVVGNLGIDFIHAEDRYIDFNRQKLIPYQISDRGPATAIGDIDNDGNTDIFFGGSKYASSQIYVQKDSGFQNVMIPSLLRDSIQEVVDALILKDPEGKPILFEATGGGDFFGQAPPLLDTSFVLSDSLWNPAPVPASFENAGVVVASDYDEDGKIEVFVGNHAITGDYGRIPASHLLEYSDGAWHNTESAEFREIGMVTDAVWSDFNGDGAMDLIVVGEWMTPRFYQNESGRLKEVHVIQGILNGLWQAIAPFDMDGDGDMDYALGNWGLNTKFKASREEPVRMYYGDFDQNRDTETLVTLNKNGKDYPIESLDGLSGQLEFLRRSFTTYSDFAGKTVEEILPKEELQKAKVYELHELSSGYLENENGRFRFVPFITELQTAPIMAFERSDFDRDGQQELLAGGNYFGVKPYHGRLGSFSGAMIKSKNDVFLGHTIGLDLARKSVRDLNVIRLNNQHYLLVTLNDAAAEVYAF